MTSAPCRALIAEDEPLLAQALVAELARLWPDLQVLATVGDGAAAVAQALRLKPELLFFDIRMPGLSGLEAAAELADEWDAGTPFPALVFVTAYDEYAVKAFEAQAIDYVLKPVQTARLQKTVAKLKALLGARAQGPDPLEAALGQLRALLAQKNDLTLKELRGAAGLKCSLQAINVVLGKMGLTYKKRHSGPASKTAPT